jgi:GxxExxY protein
MDYVDAEVEPDPQLNAITNAVIGAAIDVHRELGPGHGEGVYQKAMEIELTARAIPFFRQHPIELIYRGHVVGHGRLDLLVDNSALVEIKSVEALGRVQALQVLSYLRVTCFSLGLLINFNVKLVDGVRRIAKWIPAHFSIPSSLCALCLRVLCARAFPVDWR